MFVDINEYTSFRELKKQVEDIKNTTFNAPIELRFAPAHEALAKKVEREVIDLGYEYTSQYKKDGMTIKEFY